jgi:endoglucanase
MQRSERRRYGRHGCILTLLLNGPRLCGGGGPVAAGGSYGTFTPNITKAGNYQVYAWHAQGSNRATDAKHVITYNGGSVTVDVNQQINGGKWNFLGTYNFAAGTTGYVRIHDAHVDSTKIVVADAVRFVYVP